MDKLRVYLRLARTHQYLKNGFIWLPLFFDYKLGDGQAVWQTLWAFLAFSFLASSVYIINDLKDIQEDRRHPIKKTRPLASGEVGPGAAVVCVVVFLVLAGASAWVNREVGLFAVLGSYFLLNMAYTGFLKHLPIIDVVCIALGFVLRIFAGGIAAGVTLSHWIVAMTFLLALFLALAKRRDDLILAANGNKARPSLDGYSLEFVSISMAVMAAVIIVSYLLYTVSPDTIQKHGTDQLYLTSFWIIIAILRFLQITIVEERSGSPTMILLQDHFLQVVILLWVLSFFFLFYVVGTHSLFMASHSATGLMRL